MNNYLGMTKSSKNKMQLFAIDCGSPVLAENAEKKKNYTCPECKGFVRLRSGPHRQAHYFHIQSQPHCRQHQKSAEHLQAQLKLLDLLPKGECSLERSFPSISRIADAVWETKNIVFEIQCSPISKQEVEQRTDDYKSMGMHVVWILHDKRFNQRKLSAAESHLRSQTSYYTNISQVGKGIIYDQFEVVMKAVRKYKGLALPIKVGYPQPIKASQSRITIRNVETRNDGWEISFQGDLLDRLSKANENSWLLLASIEKRFFNSSWSNLRPLIALRRFYMLLFDGLIRSCSLR